MRLDSDILSRLEELLHVISNSLDPHNLSRLNEIVEDLREYLARYESDLAQEIHY